MNNIVINESRRDFLKVSGTVAGGLALGFYLPQGPRVAQAAASHSPNAWISIGTIIRLPFLLHELKWDKMFIHQ